MKKSGFCSAHRDGENKNCEICYPKMTEEITQEQAVKVAKWLDCGPGKNMSGGCDGGDIGWYYRNTWIGADNKLQKWITSPEGQEAVMDKLEELRLGISTGFLSADSIKTLEIYDWVNHRWQAGAPTRQLALIEAVLEMLKGGE